MRISTRQTKGNKMPTKRIIFEHEGVRVRVADPENYEIQEYRLGVNTRTKKEKSAWKFVGYYPRSNPENLLRAIHRYLYARCVLDAKLVTNIGESSKVMRSVREALNLLRGGQ
jgi:hypothetical protein